MSFFLHPIRSLSEYISQLNQSSSKIHKYIAKSLSLVVLPIFESIGHIFTKLSQAFDTKFRASPHKANEQTQKINSVAENSIISKNFSENVSSNLSISNSAIVPRQSVESFCKIVVKSDGNCFFHALAKGLGRTEESAHENLRQELVTSLKEYLLDESSKSHLEDILKQEIIDWIIQTQQQLEETFQTILVLTREGKNTLDLRNQMLETMNIFTTSLGLEKFNESSNQSFEDYFYTFNDNLLVKAFEENLSDLINVYLEKLGTPDFHVGKIAYEVMAKSKNIKIFIHTINEKDPSNQYPVTDTINAASQAENEVHLIFNNRHYDYLHPED